MRLFIATFIDKELFEDLLPQLQEDFAGHSKGKWVELHNLHFTYKFLGEVEEEKAKEIYHSIRPILEAEHTSDIVLKGMGTFPNPKEAKVLFIDVTNPDGKAFRLLRNIDAKLKKFGFKKEGKKFRPHVTLQRPKGSDGEPFADVVYKYRNINVGKMPKFKISLVKSTLTAEGPIYEILKYDD